MHKMTNKFCLVHLMSGVIYHMIVIYGTLMSIIKKKNIWSYFFHFFSKFWFSGGCKRAKNVPKWERVLSVMLHISRIKHHMIFIYDAHVWNDNTSMSFFHFFKILIFRAVKGVKGQKIARNHKTLCMSCLIFQEPYII